MILRDILQRASNSNRLKELDFVLKIMRFAPNLPLLARAAGQEECLIVVNSVQEKTNCIRQFPHIQFVTLSELPTHFINHNAVPLMIEQNALESLVSDASDDLKLMSHFAELVALWDEYFESTKEIIDRLSHSDRELITRKSAQINALLDPIAHEEVKCD